MSLPKLVIPLTIQFSIRYVIRTGLLNALRQISEPILLLGWDDPELYNELKSNGYEVFYVPQVQMNTKFSRLRKKIQVAHFQRIRSTSTKIDRRRYQLSLTLPARMRNMIRNTLFEFLGNMPGNFENWLQLEDAWMETETNFSEYKAIIEKINPDGLFSVTPYLLEEEFLIRAAAKAGVKLVTAILSFDNLTTRPHLPVLFNKYLLWNEYNRQELLRIYPEVRIDDVEIIGAPQFDFYYDSSYIWDEVTWRNRLGIPDHRPIILFGAGPETISPVEPHIVAQLDKAIDRGLIQGKPIILLRLHPVDNLARWDSLLQISTNILFDLPWQLGEKVAGKTNISCEDIKKLASTLKYCQVHINTSSTMTIDGAIFDRPQIGPAYDDRKGKIYDRAMRELYLREHYLPITNSGGLQIAYSFEQLINYINDAFQNPERYHDERKRMVQALCSYNGKSTQRITDTVEKFLHENKFH